jgi:hypothetical protein
MMPFELPPQGPPIVYRQPAATQRIHPVLGLLRWEEDCWQGIMPVTRAAIHLDAEPETPEVFPEIWAKWLARVDGDTAWIVKQIRRQLKELAGYGWPVFPFEPSISLVVFGTNGFTVYLNTPNLESSGHCMEVHFNARMKVRSASPAG